MGKNMMDIFGIRYFLVHNGVSYIFGISKENEFFYLSYGI